MTRLDVVTGFLGAGKTTLLSRYLRWLEKQNIRYCVIENEFGLAGVDGALLGRNGARVMEISGSCVCCTLKVTLHDLIVELVGQVDRIILEPSGLFCGDDLMDILSSPACPAIPGMWVGVVDPMSIAFMNDEDLAVLQSELMQAGSIVISKAQMCEKSELDALPALIERMLPTPPPAVWLNPWNAYSDDEWFPALQAAGTVPRNHTRRIFDHTAMFQSTTFSPRRTFNEAQVTELLCGLSNPENGEVLRAKGTLCAPNGTWHVNFTPGCTSVSLSDEVERSMLNVIGRSLNRRSIRALWGGN